MGRNKNNNKKFINKKNARTYHLVTPSNKSTNTSTTNFLKPFGHEVPWQKSANDDPEQGQFDDADEIVSSEEIPQNEQQQNEYNYDKHLKEMGGGTYISKEGFIAEQINETDEIDPELLEEMQRAETMDQVDELDDDFVMMANESGSEDGGEIKIGKKGGEIIVKDVKRIKGGVIEKEIKDDFDDLEGDLEGDMEGELSADDFDPELLKGKNIDDFEIFEDDDGEEDVKDIKIVKGGIGAEKGVGKGPWKKEWVEDDDVDADDFDPSEFPDIRDAVADADDLDDKYAQFIGEDGEFDEERYMEYLNARDEYDDSDDDEGDRPKHHHHHGTSNRKNFPKHENMPDTLLDEKFNYELNQFEDDNSDDIELPSFINEKDYTDVLDDFLAHTKKERYEPDTGLSQHIMNIPGIVADSDDEGEFEIVYVKEKPQFDAESILSTYTTTENHPQLIAITDDKKSIKINKRGLPEQQQSKETSSEDGDVEEEVKVNKGIARNKKETKEQKKLRKQKVKEGKRVQREKNKELKTEFNKEINRQQNMHIGQIANKTIIQYQAL